MDPMGYLPTLIIENQPTKKCTMHGWYGIATCFAQVPWLAQLLIYHPLTDPEEFWYIYQSTNG